jgi:hypothetical protein
MFAVGATALAACTATLLIIAHWWQVPNPLHWGEPRTASLELRVDELESAPLVVFLDVPRPAAREAQTDPGATVRITSVNSSFQPRFQVAPLAASVDLGNQDTIPHNTHVFDGARTLFNVAVPLTGVRVHKVMTRSGIFDVRCDFHPWMRAWVFVPPGPHHAVIWTPGEATLRDIPPGSYRLHVWTPAHGHKIGTLTLDSGEMKSLRLAGG